MSPSTTDASHHSHDADCAGGGTQDVASVLVSFADHAGTATFVLGLEDLSQFVDKDVHTALATTVRSDGGSCGSLDRLVKKAGGEELATAGSLRLFRIGTGDTVVVGGGPFSDLLVSHVISTVFPEVAHDKLTTSLKPFRSATLAFSGLPRTRMLMPLPSPSSPLDLRKETRPWS